jgi:hypothetical protein
MGLASGDPDQAWPYSTLNRIDFDGAELGHVEPEPPCLTAWSPLPGDITSNLYG